MKSHCSPVKCLCAILLAPLALLACLCSEDGADCDLTDKRHEFVPLPQAGGPQGPYAPTVPPQPMQIYGQQPVFGQPAMPPPQYYPQPPPPPPT